MDKIKWAATIVYREFTGGNISAANLTKAWAIYRKYPKEVYQTIIKMWGR